MSGWWKFTWDASTNQNPASPKPARPLPPIMLHIDHLHAAYDGSQILRNVTLTVPGRQVVCLMGRNGVGKKAPATAGRWRN